MIEVGPRVSDEKKKLITKLVSASSLVGMALSQAIQRARQYAAHNPTWTAEECAMAGIAVFSPQQDSHG